MQCRLVNRSHTATIALSDLLMVLPLVPGRPGMPGLIGRLSGLRGGVCRSGSMKVTGASHGPASRSFLYAVRDAGLRVPGIVVTDRFEETGHRSAERDSTVRGSTNFEYLPPPNFSPRNFSKYPAETWMTVCRMFNRAIAKQIQTARWEWPFVAHRDRARQGQTALSIV